MHAELVFFRLEKIYVSEALARFARSRIYVTWVESFPVGMVGTFGGSQRQHSQFGVLGALAYWWGGGGGGVGAPK